MADWLIHALFQIGGTAALLAVAGFVMGKWVWKKIDAALESYNKAYYEQKGAIDARIDRIEKLVEEQARLTGTVETIKDEIAAQAKSRDNRWEFRKDVYVSLLTAATIMRGILRRMATFSEMHRSQSREEVSSGLQPLVDELWTSTKQFANAAVLAPLAMADDLVALVTDAMVNLPRAVDVRTPDGAAFLNHFSDKLHNLEIQMQAAGRKDLWGDTKLEAKIETATQNS